MVNSTAETGLESSNASKTEGCKMPIFPIAMPLYMIDAHLPSKYAGSNKAE